MRLFLLLLYVMHAEIKICETCIRMSKLELTLVLLLYLNCVNLHCLEFNSRINKIY
jgi:hypothetical protein